MTEKGLGAALPRLVDQLVASYVADPRTQHIDRAYLPERVVIVEICDLLLELTYPGYIGRRGLTRHNIAYHVGELLPRLWDQLCAQIAQSLGIEGDAGAEAEAARTAPAAQSAKPAGEAPGERAARLAQSFLERMPTVRAMLGQDVQAHYDGDPAALSTHEIILAYPGVIAITIHRYAHELYALGVPLMPRIMGEHAHVLTGIDINPGARIGRSFCIDHGTGVVIGETAIIGDNVKIYQGVTLGALSFPKDERGRLIRGHKRHPTVGNNVTIYANAIVLGGETVVGDNAVVGGSVFVTQSVQPGHQVSITPPLLKVRPPKPTQRDAGGNYVPDWAI